MSLVSVFCDSKQLLERAQACAQGLGVVLNPASKSEYQLMFTAEGVFLQTCDAKKHGQIMVDFCAGGAAHRRHFGGGKGQLIAKAVGITSAIKPSIFDATAGLGQDAFVLACLGCKVTMMERSPVAFALLQDGLNRAQEFAQEQDPPLAAIIANMALIEGDSLDYLNRCHKPLADVVYLDPMFPERQKNAAVKKEMAAFHRVIGQDLDDDGLLDLALAAAEYRVVVKRSRHAPFLAERAPSHVQEGKSSRFDLYTLKSLTRSGRSGDPTC